MTGNHGGLPQLTVGDTKHGLYVYVRFYKPQYTNKPGWYLDVVRDGNVVAENVHGDIAELVARRIIESICGNPTDRTKGG